MPAVRQSLPVDQPADPGAKRSGPPVAAEIVDIRSQAVTEGFNLKDDVASLLDPSDGGPRKLPTLLLYDERGLQLFEDVSSDANEEAPVLTKHFRSPISTNIT